MTQVFIWKDGRCVINPAFAFEMSQTHGIPPEILEDWVNKEFPIGSPQRLWAISKAYDEAHGSKYSEKIKDVVK